MKKHLSLVCSLLLLPTLVACQGTLDVGVAQTPSLPTCAPVPASPSSDTLAEAKETPLSPTSPPELTVEEYPIAAQDVDTPMHFEYLERISSEVLQKRQAWREPTPEGRVASTNEVLASFGYRLGPRQELGWDYPFYDLYKNEILFESDLTTVWPVQVTASGDDFALLVEKLNGPTLLVHRGLVQQWDPVGHAFLPPVLVGDELVAVDVEREEELAQYSVTRGGEVEYTFTVTQTVPAEPVKGLWSWGEHWVLEVDGEVVWGDGWSLNEETGYDEIFGWRLLKGQPFYFFREGDRIGVYYAGQVLPYQYEEVIHYRCCEPSAFNVAGNEAMVWFHALREGMWYYVEMGIYQ